MGMTNEQFEEYKKNLAREMATARKLMLSANEELRQVGEEMLDKIIEDMQSGLQKP